MPVRLESPLRTSQQNILYDVNIFSFLLCKCQLWFTTVYLLCGQITGLDTWSEVPRPTHSSINTPM